MKGKDRSRPTAPPKGRRFSRLPEGLDMTELAQSVWTRPTFEAKEVKGATTFIFTVPLQDKIRSDHPRIYRSLFESGGPDWDTALQKAYSSAQSGEKRVSDYIDTMLYIVFREALQVLMKDAKRLAKNTSDDLRYRSASDNRHVIERIVDNEATIFALTSNRPKGRKRTRPIDNTRPIRLATRFATLDPQVNLLRQTTDALKAGGTQDENLLRAKIGEAFKNRDWINHVVNGSAFLELPADEIATTTIQSSLGGQWTSWQLTMGILKCEEKISHGGRPPSVITIVTMVRDGKKLLAKSTAAQT